LTQTFFFDIIVVYFEKEKNQGRWHGGKMKSWSTKENKFLRKAYNNESISKIAKALMRSKQSIRNHVHILRKKGYTFDRVSYVKEMSESEKMQEQLEPIFHTTEREMAGSGLLDCGMELPAEYDEWESSSRPWKLQQAVLENAGGQIHSDWPHPTEHDESDEIEDAKATHQLELEFNAVDKKAYTLLDRLAAEKRAQRREEDQDEYSRSFDPEPK